MLRDSEPAMPRLSLPVQSPILDGCGEPNCWKSSGDGAASALALGNDDASSTDKRLSWARFEGLLRMCSHARL